MDVHPRSLALAALALAGASLAGVALTSGGWRLGLGALTVAAAGVFGGVLDGAGSAPRRTIVLLGALIYLVMVPVLGFATRGLEELGVGPERWWIVAMLGLAELFAAFFGARRWRGGGRASGPLAAATVTQ